MSQPGIAKRPAVACASEARLARDDERPAAAPERGAAAQQRVAVAQAGEGAERELRELVAALARERVELLDVVQCRDRRERRLDAPVHEGVERERVVGAGREAETEVHGRPISVEQRVQLGDHERGHARELGERVVEAPECAVGLLDLVRDHAQLERGNALVHARREHRVALHRLDRRAGRAADARARADRQRERIGQRAPRGGEQPRVGRDRLAVAVAVDRLGADHGREQRHAAAAPGARDADVQDRRRAALGDRVLGRGVRRVRPDAADERPRPRGAGELLER